MAFTKTPEQSTYQTKRVPLVNITGERSSALTKDETMINCYAEIDQKKEIKEDESWVVQRPGNSKWQTETTGEMRGTYYWKTTGNIYYVKGNTLYSRPENSAVVTTIDTFSTSTGPVGFEEFLYISTAVDLCVTDGTTLKKITSAGAVSSCMDGDLPVPHLTDLVFLDGYLFLVDATTADIWNSDNDDPFSYTPGNFITAESSPDVVSRLTKLNNYLLALGENSIEYFWDAAEASGSPMKRNETPYKKIGYVGGLDSVGGKLFFVGREVNGAPRVMKIEDFKVDPVSSPEVDRALAATDLTQTIYGNIIGINGSTFYILFMKESTWAYCIESSLWSRWILGAGTTYPLTSTTTSSTSNYTIYATYLNDSSIYKIDIALNQDNGVNYTRTIVTQNEDFKTIKRKFCGQASLVADRIPANFSLYWSDDDYQTWNGPRTIALNTEIPMTTQLGAFRRRAWKVSFSANYFFRAKVLEIDINMGNG